MKLSDMTDKLKNGAYGDQGISPATANEYIWTNVGSYIVDPLNNKMLSDLFLDNAGIIVNGEFDEDIEFPSVKYIKDAFDYTPVNNIGLSTSTTLPSSRTTTFSLINIIADTTDVVGKILMSATFKTTKYGTWSYKILVEFPDGIGEDERVKKITIYPREIKGQDYKVENYIKDLTQPQFFDVEEADTSTAIDLQVQLPSLLGDTWTIDISIDDYIVFDDDTSTISTYIIDSLLQVDENGKYSLQETDLTLNEFVLSDYETLQPEFDTFIMNDRDIDTMMTYIVSVYNWTSDEAETGQQQSQAFIDFNGNLRNYPSKTFINLIPDEFKRNALDQERTLFNSGIKLVKRRY